jgi:transcriptional regulator with XRE-family HTH domain
MDKMVYEKIAEYIERRGIKQRALATYMGISPHAMRHILAGRRKIGVEEYVNICRFLEVPYEKFLD